MRRSLLVLSNRALVVVTLGAIMAACGGSGKKTTGTTTTTIAKAPVDVTKVTVVGANKSPALSDAQRSAIASALTKYVALATMTPVQTGIVNPDLLQVFDPGAAATLVGTDRATLIDEGLPKGVLRVTTNTAALTVLSNADNAAIVVNADVAFDASADTAQGPVRIQRTGTFVLQPDGDNWRIHAYDINVTRSTPEQQTTTTAVKK